MRRPRKLRSTSPKRAYVYLRLSVDKEDGKAQSIEAQRFAVAQYAQKNGIEIVEEFVDSGLSGQSDRRPEFNRMIDQAIDGTKPVSIVLFYRLSRMARNMRIFFNTLDGLAEEGVEVVSITENFGEGRSKRLGQTFTAFVAEQGAVDASIFTCKSRRENARQGFYNGGPVPFGYETYVARKDGEKERKKLRIVPAEARIIEQIFEWAEMGLGGRAIIANLNSVGCTLRGAKFSNGNLSGILGRETYAGVYYDKTADDEGHEPEPEDWIPVPCPVIIPRERFEKVQALRASRNPRRKAPHVAAGTTMLTGIAKCGSANCSCVMTIRTGKSGQYSYYACANRVNKGEKCSTPSIRRELLDDLVVNAVERQLLAPQRLKQLLSDVIDLSDQKRAQRQAELCDARAQQTRLRSAIERLLIAVEDGIIGARDPIFAKRLDENRSSLAAATARISTLEAQLETGTAKITPATVERFGELLSSKIRDKDPTLRKAYVRMFVSSVIVSQDQILISGPKAVLENAICQKQTKLVGMVPIFDQQWCPEEDSNLHAVSSAAT